MQVLQLTEISLNIQWTPPFNDRFFSENNKGYEKSSVIIKGKVKVKRNYSKEDAYFIAKRTYRNKQQKEQL
jgi:c-di-AMP phosphodiesterase-like protein